MSQQKREKVNQIKNDLGTAAQVASSVWTIVTMYDNLNNRFGNGKSTSGTNTKPADMNFDKPKVKPMKKNKGKLTPKSTSLTSNK